MLILAACSPRGTDVSPTEQGKESATLKLDLNSAYLTALGAGGSAGETMTLYSVVNTFLFNYPDASSLALTVDGKNIETEHSSYKNPFTEMQYLRE